MKRDQKEWKSQRKGRKAVRCCFLDVAWLVHLWTQRSYGYRANGISQHCGRQHPLQAVGEKQGQEGGRGIVEGRRGRGKGNWRWTPLRDIIYRNVWSCQIMYKRDAKNKWVKGLGKKTYPAGTHSLCSHFYLQLSPHFSRWGLRRFFRSLYSTNQRAVNLFLTTVKWSYLIFTMESLWFNMNIHKLIMEI